MAAAGVLLTGGASRRMGQDKASLRMDGVSLSERTAALLREATAVAVEVGPGHTDLPRVAEAEPGRGPLAALVAGRAARAAPDVEWNGSILVLATDMPNLTPGLLRWLGTLSEREMRSVVPVDAAGRPQPLCACYTAADLDVAASLVASGRQAMHHLLGRTDPLLAGPDLWIPAAGSATALFDIDTPADLERLLCRPDP